VGHVTKPYVSSEFRVSLEYFYLPRQNPGSLPNKGKSLMSWVLLHLSCIITCVNPRDADFARVAGSTARNSHLGAAVNIG
jgi:hypothetical protein